MALRKYGKGKILRDKEEQEERKLAAKHFSAKDRRELEEELAQDAPESDAE